MHELKDKVAIITGGGYGIGKQIALTYARAGAKLVLAARTPGPLEEARAEVTKLGAATAVIQADVAKEADCARLVDETVKAFGRVDILVNNAGIAGPDQANHRNGPARMARSDRHQSDRRVAGLARRDSRDGQTGRWQYLDDLFRRGASRISAAIALRRVQMGNDRSHPNVGR